MATLNISSTVKSMIEEFFNRLTESDLIRKMVNFDTDEISNRLKICQKCTNLDDSGAVLTCKACGCPVSVKVLWPYSACPANKWATPKDGEDAPAPPDNLIEVPLLEGPSLINDI